MGMKKAARRAAKEAASLERVSVIPAPLPGIDNYWPFDNFNGYSYPLTNLSLTLPGSREEEIENNFESYVARAYKSNGVVFACELARMMIFSEARFQFRQLRNGRPGDLFGNPSLDILEHPWPNATTGDLLTRVITDADFAGNFYATRRGDRIKRLRPSWVTMVIGTDNPDDTANDIDAEFLGIIYYEGGELSPTGPPQFIARSQLAHFAPIPDPTAHVRGMSWITPLVREIMADSAATSHKLKFFENGATPNLVVKRQDAPTREKFDEWKNIIESGHSGVANAYRTLYLTAGADATVVGKDLQQLEFKATQGAGETRIAAAAGVHPVVVGLSEGMQGASLNAGNFGSARRLTADKTFRPLWRNLAGSFETLVRPPSNAQLWYDDRDIAFLREDKKDAADIQFVKAQTVRQLIDGGYKADDVVKAVEAEDLGLLIGNHTGLFSVQLQAPGSTKMPAGEVPGETPVGEGTKPETIPAGDVSSKPLAAGSTKPTNGKTPVAAGK